MSSNDSIIFQLTNIGALQREPQFQTPKKSSSSGPLTPPSSKGKWWTPFSERRPSPTRPFPSRTDSLPRPTFNLPPRTPKRSFLNSVCTVCDEPIFTRGSGERIIELECGHISHQECLVVSFDESRGADEILEMFPKCKMCGSDVRCLPKNRDFKDKLISEYLIRSRSLRPGLVPATARSTRSDVQVPLASGRYIDSRPRKKFSLSTPQVRQISKRPLLPSVADLNSIISQDNSFCDAKSVADLSHLRASHIAVLSANFKDKLQYGNLRLVDKLAVSRDGVNFTTCACYLFETALAVADLVSEGPELLLQDLELFTPISDVKVETVEKSVFKCTIRCQELYLTESLDTETTQIIQKWISGLLNQELVFDEQNFTSTLHRDQAMSDSLASLQASDSVIIRRGTRISVIGNELNKRDTIGTVMTTVSSILSLKRDRPDELIVVLQWNLKETNNGLALDIYNNVRALSLTYRDLKVCIVNEEGRVANHALAKDFFTTSDRVLGLKDNNGTVRFDPKWLKNTFYPGNITANIGIAVISDISLESDKSCLLMDYKPFARVGRRRPNELKVKIGYLLLNVDYSKRIEELVEVGSWNQILEALSYSFSLAFGDDDEDDDYDDDFSDEEESEAKKDEPFHEETESHYKTMKTVLIESDTDEANSTRSLSLEHEIPTSTDGQILNLEQEAATSRIKRAGSQSAKRAERGWDPLFEDIESAIRELQRGKSASPETAGRQNELYNYL
ncbi:Ste5p TDEL_0F03740 [Torulaspora delbrueckii]|uniref:RING-type domain-containing protein n=1 Tax=Torulaspora delbrueckii TaxID=4950 RepID=G8ZX41_TORDE|nr:hypothetical protein TDEL_0F03740 [Torulaspora delbrueckii]CCE93185.1 hypothetical protein TDEL_0F03740 [Torulaspora delbrueckii]